MKTYKIAAIGDDGIGPDEYVDWLIEAGCPIQVACSAVTRPRRRRSRKMAA